MFWALGKVPASCAQLDLVVFGRKETGLTADVLLAMLGSATLPETIPIKSVHFALWELSKEAKYSSLLVSLSFVEGPGVPVSEEVETALFRLCSSGLCTVDNPDFRYVRTAATSREAMRLVLERHSDKKHLEELKELSGDFEEKVLGWMAREGGNLSLRSA